MKTTDCMRKPFRYHFPCMMAYLSFMRVTVVYQREQGVKPLWPGPHPTCDSSPPVWASFCLVRWSRGDKDIIPPFPRRLHLWCYICANGGADEYLQRQQPDRNSSGSFVKWQPAERWWAGRQETESRGGVGGGHPAQWQGRTTCPFINNELLHCSQTCLIPQRMWSEWCNLLFKQTAGLLRRYDQEMRRVYFCPGHASKIMQHLNKAHLRWSWERK